MGWRYDLISASGQRLGVVRHLRGRCDLVVHDDQVDPDLARNLVSLTRQEAVALAEVLAGQRCGCGA